MSLTHTHIYIYIYKFMDVCLHVFPQLRDVGRAIVNGHDMNAN